MEQQPKSQKGILNSPIKGEWPQIGTEILFIAAISLRFPFWFVFLSVVVIGTAITYVAQRLGSPQYRSVHSSSINITLILSGLASAGLSWKWLALEQQQHLARGSLLRLSGHTQAASDPLTAWMSVTTQWGSNCVFLLIVVTWAMSTVRPIRQS